MHPVHPSNAPDWPPDLGEFSQLGPQATESLAVWCAEASLIVLQKHRQVPAKLRDVCREMITLARKARGRTKVEIAASQGILANRDARIKATEMPTEFTQLATLVLDSATNALQAVQGLGMRHALEAVDLAHRVFETLNESSTDAIAFSTYKKAFKKEGWNGESLPPPGFFPPLPTVA